MGLLHMISGFEHLHFTDGPDESDDYQSTPNSRRGSQQNYVRRLWKRAIMEELICIKAKKISEQAGGDRRKSDNKKLDYEELLLYDVDEQRKEWKRLLNAMDRQTTRIDMFELKEMVKKGLNVLARYRILKFE